MQRDPPGFQTKALPCPAQCLCVRCPLCPGTLRSFAYQAALSLKDLRHSTYRLLCVKTDYSVSLKEFTFMIFSL